jgi:ABC-type methionine transport system ATPase subunit
MSEPKKTRIAAKAPKATPKTAAKAAPKPPAKARKTAKSSHRYWLNFTAAAARRPLIWEMSQKFEVAFDIRSANVTADVGIMAVEFTGVSQEITDAITWLEKHGVQVDPI